jgi:hypothetical protein
MATELIITPEAQQDVDEGYITGMKIVDLAWEKSFPAVWTPYPNFTRKSTGIGEAIPVCHFLRVHWQEGDRLWHLPCIPGPKEVAQLFVVACQASPNQSVLVPR